LRKALEFYKRFASQNSPDPMFRKRMAQAHHQVGKIHHKLGEYDRGEIAFSREITLHQQLRKETPREQALRWNLVRAFNARGVLRDLAGRPGDARRDHQEAKKILVQLVKEHPKNADYQSQLGGTLHNLAMILNDQGDYLGVIRLLKQAIPHQEAALKIQPRNRNYRAYLRNHHGLKGTALHRLKRSAEAEQEYRAMLKLAIALANEVPSSPGDWQEVARGHSNLGSVLTGPNRLVEARKELEKAVEIGEILVRDFPAVPAYRRQLAAGCVNHGQLLRQLGHPKEAIIAFHKALDHSQFLVRRFPGVPPLHKELARVRRIFVDFLLEQDRPREAEKAYQHELAVYQGLVKEYPQDSTHRRKLADCWIRLSRFLGQTNRLQEALAASRQALDVLASLLKVEPEKLQHRLALGDAWYNRGHVLKLADQPQQALEAFQTAANICQLLVDQSPKIPLFRRKLATCINDVGLMLTATEKPREALAAYRTAIKHQRQLVDEYPRDLDFLSDLAGTLNNFALLIRERGELAPALKMLQEAVNLQQDVLEKDPHHEQGRVFLRNHYHHLAKLLIDMEKPAEAADVLAKLNTLLKKHPNGFLDTYDRATYQRYLSRHIHDLGVLQYQLGKLPEAEKSFAEALIIDRRLVKQFPRVAAYRSSLGTTLFNQALMVRKAGQLLKARRLFEEAIDHQKAAHEAEPVNSQFRDLLRRHHEMLALTLQELKEPREAAEAAEEMFKIRPDSSTNALKAAELLAGCITLVQKDSGMTAEERNVKSRQYEHRIKQLLTIAVEKCPDRPPAHNNLAWSLANHSSPLVRNPARAVELVRKAVTKAPTNGAYWNTMGVALFYAGQWKDAKAALGKSMAFRHGGDSYDWFVLSMAHCKLGEKHEARKWFHKAVAWMDDKKNQGKIDADLRRFRAEAAALLGD
jgi:tetratricopeptide (TPR) repeat protein